MLLKMKKHDNHNKITAKSLREDYEKKLKDLQSSCNHDELSVWMDYMWAPGHYSNYKVKICNICEKQILIKIHCDACGKEIIYNDDDFISWKNHLCNDCQKKGKSYCIYHKEFYDDECPGCKNFDKLVMDAEKNERKTTKI